LGWDDEIEVVRADLRAAPLKTLESAFVGVDVLAHLAAKVTGSEDVQFAATVVGTERLLEAMAHTETRRLILASSLSVYDWSAIGGTLDERSPVESGADLYERDGYAVAKTWQERVARREAERHGWDLVVLRPGFIWGRDHAYLAALGQRAGPIHLVFGPSGRLPMTHVENCAALFARAAESPPGFQGTFNVIDSDDVRIWSYLGEYLRRSGQRGLRVPIPYTLAYASTHLARAISRWLFRGKGKLPSILIPCRFEARFKPLRFSNQLARDLFGWNPPHDYEACLRKTYGPAEQGGH
jgi:UDP-glucose 4-epimerase